MQLGNRKNLIVGALAGAGLAAFVGVLMGQGASQPVKSETQYFVTAEGDGAHLWVREGSALRVVGHGECKNCPMHKHDDHDHKDGDGHDHPKEAPKK